MYTYIVYIYLFFKFSTSKLEFYIFFKFSLDTIITIKTFTLVSVMAHGRPVVSTCSTFYV